MGMSKEKIVEILNANEHMRLSNWAFDQWGFIAGSHGSIVEMNFAQAEKAAQSYVIDEAEQPESKPGQVEILRRLRAISENSDGIDKGDIENTARLALELIADLFNEEPSSEDDGTSLIPTAEEALAIINANDMAGREWELFALSTEDGDGGRDILRHEEFIGTAMYHKAKRACQ